MFDMFPERSYYKPDLWQQAHLQPAPDFQADFGLDGDR
jgi:hypothetical protein